MAAIRSREITGLRIAYFVRVYVCISNIVGVLYMLLAYCVRCWGMGVIVIASRRLYALNDQGQPDPQSKGKTKQVRRVAKNTVFTPG